MNDTTQTKEVATKEMNTQVCDIATDLSNGALIAVQVERERLELALRKADVIATSSIIPERFRNNPGDVLISLNLATRMGIDEMMVMQNLYIVYGTPGWSSQFLISLFNNCGLFSRIKYRFTGEKGKDTYGCVAYATEISTGEEIIGTKVTMQIAKDEGWYEKKGSKWKTIPDLMLQYRSASWMIRANAPEIALGFQTREEIEDIVDGEVTNRRVRSGSSNVVKSKLIASPSNPVEEAKPDEPQNRSDENPNLEEARKLYAQAAIDIKKLAELDAMLEQVAMFEHDLVQDLTKFAQNTAKQKGGKVNVDLQTFCDPDVIRFDIGKPFRFGSHMVGTNGVILVAVKSADKTKNGYRKLPPISQLNWKVFRDAEFTPLGDQVVEETPGWFSQCPECDGMGLVGGNIKPCPEMEFDHEFCKACNTRGWTGGVTCPKCKGECYVAECEKIGNGFIDLRYSKLIRDLPGTIEVAKLGDTAIPFKFDGGVGWVCPMTEYGGVVRA